MSLCTYGKAQNRSVAVIAMLIHFRSGIIVHYCRDLGRAKRLDELYYLVISSGMRAGMYSQRYQTAPITFESIAFSLPIRICVANYEFITAIKSVYHAR